MRARAPRDAGAAEALHACPAPCVITLPSFTADAAGWRGLARADQRERHSVVARDSETNACRPAMTCCSAAITTCRSGELLGPIEIHT